MAKQGSATRWTLVAKARARLAQGCYDDPGVVRRTVEFYVEKVWADLNLGCQPVNPMPLPASIIVQYLPARGLPTHALTAPLLHAVPSVLGERTIAGPRVADRQRLRSVARAV